MTTALRLTVLIALVTSLLAVAAQAGAATDQCFGYEADWVGTDGQDVVDAADIGDPNEDGFITIVTGPGKDTVTNTTDMNSAVCLGSGRDTFTGGPGNDLVRGGGGRDTIDTGSGDDTIHGNGGDDEIHAGDGDDIVKGGRGADLVFAGSGGDTIKGNDGNDDLWGGPGNDVISSGKGNDIINGDEDDDHSRGGPGYDRIFGVWGNDVISGGRDFDQCLGGQQTKCEDTTGNKVSKAQHRDAWEDLIADVFANWEIEDQVDWAVEISWCESRGNVQAVNSMSGTAGLFQHRPIFWQDRVNRVLNHPTFAPDFPADADPFDPVHNVTVAALLVWESIPGNQTESGHKHGPWGHWDGCGPIVDAPDWG